LQQIRSGETGISTTIEGGPVDKQSTGDFYPGQSPPKTLLSSLSSGSSCPLTGRQFIQKDTKQMFLVPINGQPTIENNARRNNKGRMSFDLKL
jgi:hypothetical protein